MTPYEVKQLQSENRMLLREIDRGLERQLQVLKERNEALAEITRLRGQARATGETRHE